MTTNSALENMRRTQRPTDMCRTESARMGSHRVDTANVTKHPRTDATVNLVESTPAGGRKKVEACAGSDMKSPNHTRNATADTSDVGEVTELSTASAGSRRQLSDNERDWRWFLTQEPLKSIDTTQLRKERTPAEVDKLLQLVVEFRQLFSDGSVDYRKNLAYVTARRARFEQVSLTRAW